MATIKKYNGSSWENAVVRKFGTVTEAVENPLYSDGTAITAYTIKGNTVQNGTPTPSAPISVNGVGNKTANLLSGWTKGQRLDASTGVARTDIVEACTTDYIAVDKTKTYIAKPLYLNYSSFVAAYNASKQFLGRMSATQRSSVKFDSTSFTSGTPQGVGDIAYIRITIYNAGSQTGDIDDAIAMETMMNEGSTVLPYEPYGYKIPISSGSTTTPIYLSQQLFKIGDYADQDTSEGTVTYNIRKYEFTGLENVTDNFGVTMVQSLFNDAPFKPEYSALSDRYIYNPIQSGLAAGLADGEFALQYSPNGYNIAIKDLRYASANAFKSYLATQYANGTPVTIYYVLITPTTETVTAPSIPTTEGTNSITVDTTVQPSEFTATWTGWHDAYVKEKSENLWNEDYTGISGTMKYNAIYVGDGEFTLSSNIINNNYSYIFFLAGRPQSGASTGTNDVYNGQSRTVTAVNGYVTIAFRSTASYSPESYNTMLNSGSTAQTYEPYWK